MDQPRDARGRRRKPALLARLTLGTALVATSIVLSAVPAAASGDSTVDGYILTNPVPGWAALPPSVTSVTATALGTLESAASNETATAAADGWGTTGPPGELLIALVRFPRPVPSSETASVDEAVNNLCESATSAAAVSTLPIPGVPNSVEGLCGGPASDGATPVTETAFIKANVVALVIGGGLPSATVEQITQSQNAKIPGGGISESSFPTALVIGLGIALVAGGIFLTIFLARRARAKRLATAYGPPGLYGVAPHPYAPVGPSGFEDGPSTMPRYPVAGLGTAAGFAGGNGEEQAERPLLPGFYPVQVPLAALGPAASSASRRQPTPVPAPYVAPVSPQEPAPSQEAVPYAAAVAAQAPVPSQATVPYPETTAFPTGFSSPAPYPYAAAATSSVPPPYSDPRRIRYGAPAVRVVEETRPAASFEAEPATGQPAVALDTAPEIAEEASAEAAWYPIDGDPYRQAYWDGSSWTSRKRWDGTDWVDEEP